MKNIIFIVFLFHIYYVKNKYVIFDLKTYKNNSNYPDEYEKFFFDNLYNMIYSEISIGPEKEKYIMEIKTNTYGLSIINHNCDIPPIDNSNTSSYDSDFAGSTIFKPIIHYIPIYQEFYAAILENKIYIKTNEGENNTKINYVFGPRNDSEYAPYYMVKPYTCFRLGFELLYRTKDIESYNDLAMDLIFQFKRAEIISSYNWFIEYDSENKDKGKLILGAPPHEYNSKKYNENYRKKVNSLIRDDESFFWDIKVNEIYFKNGTDLILDNEVNQYLKCSLEPSLGVIFGTKGYKNYIEENFFNELIKIQKKCYRSNPLILSNYITYYCKKEIKQYLKENFSPIIFQHRYLNKSFELNYEDVFKEKGDYIFFLVFFDRQGGDFWRFGKPFLYKYFFSYDYDGRAIYYYKIENDKSSGNEEKNGSINFGVIIIIIVLIVIFACLGFFIGKYIYSSTKRKKGTELNEQDNYNYESINQDN